MSDDRVYKKLEKIEEKIQEINITLVRNTDSLEYHIMRTDLIESDLKPIKNHVNLVNAGLKIVGLVVLIASFLEVIFNIF